MPVDMLLFSSDNRSLFGQVRQGLADTSGLFVTYSPERIRRAGGHIFGPMSFGSLYVVHRKGAFDKYVAIDSSLLLRKSFLVGCLLTLIVYGLFRLLKHSAIEKTLRLQVQICSMLLEGVAASYLTLLFTAPAQSGDIRNGIQLLRSLESKEAELVCVSRLYGAMLLGINEALDPGVRERFRRYIRLFQLQLLLSYWELECAALSPPQRSQHCPHSQQSQLESPGQATVRNR